MSSTIKRTILQIMHKKLDRLAAMANHSLYIYFTSTSLTYHRQNPFMTSKGSPICMISLKLILS